MKVNWIDDSAAIAVMGVCLGLEVFNTVIGVDQIDLQASMQNRAREIPLEHERVEALSLSIKQGVPIPKIVVRYVEKRRSGEYIIAGGNHRFASLSKEQSPLPCHAVVCTDVEFEILCRLLNNVVGQGMSRAEKLASAVDAATRLGCTAKYAAAIYGVSKDSVARAIRAGDVNNRIHGLFPGSKDLPGSTVDALGSLATNDNTLLAAARFISKARPSVSDITAIAKEARKKTTEAEQIDVFDRELALCKTHRRVVPRHKKQSFLRAISQLISVGEKTWAEIEIMKDEVQDAKKKTKDAIRILQRLCKEDG